MSDKVQQPMKSRRSYEAREAQRQHQRAAAIYQANRLSRSIVCGEYEQHERCRGVDSPRDDCLCECHDPEPGDVT